MITLISQNNGGATPSVEELAGWADDAGATHPILADPGADVAASFIREDPNFTGSYGLPSMQMVGPGMVVEWVNVNFPSESDVTSVLPN